MRTLLTRLEDFRLLPIFVVVSMAAGIAVGNVLRISDFALTPPIDALKAIAGGTFELSVPNAISLGVPIGLFAMMYPAMTNVRLTEVGQEPTEALAGDAFGRYMLNEVKRWRELARMAGVKE